MRNRGALIVVGLALVGLAGLLFLGSDAAPEPDAAPLASAAAPERTTAARPQPIDAPPRAPAPGAPRSPSEPPAAVVDEAYDALAGGQGRVRCGVGALLDDGAYDAQPPARFVRVHGAELTASVSAPSGEAWVQWDRRRVARMSWSEAEPGGWGRCALAPVALVEIHGTLRHASGDPAVDHEVRGCLHGSFARTDGDGAWTLEAAAGATCHPMAFVEQPDGSFGKSNVVNVPVEAPGPIEGVALVLPAQEQLWTASQQGELASQLAAMVATMVDVRRADAARARQALAQGVSPEAAAVAEALVAREEAIVAIMEHELERLDDPDEQRGALVEAWLNLN